MHERPSHLLPLVAGIVVSALLLWRLQSDVSPALRPSTSSVPVGSTNANANASAALAEAADILHAVQDALNQPDALAALRDRLDLMFSQPGARPNESVLTFKDDEAYQAFLARAAAAGLTVLGRIDGLRAVRVGFTALDGLTNDLLANAGDYTELGVNITVQAPAQPTPEERAAAPQAAVGNNLLGVLGVTGDHSSWGQGITIAVLDGGVAADATFGDRVRYIDLGLGTAPVDGHGTAVASLAAGAAGDASGIAPAANILSIRVSGADGTSDLFTLAAAIIKATDSGAQIINISLGAYSDSGALNSAIAYANSHGVVLVAAAGNDQAAQLVWPAADARVVSVGSVDAVGQQDIFSNSGEQLKLTAPGYDVQAAWLDGQRVYFTGTSASTPVVAGSIAAMMSENPGMTATEAYQTLQAYSSDGGQAGADPDYGAGSVNLGWVMNRNDPTRVDTAVSSHYYNNETGNMEFVVQNRSGSAVSGLTLTMDAGSGVKTATVPLMTPGDVYTVTTSVDKTKLATDGQLTFRTVLANPAGVTDAVPANNRAASTLTAPATP